MTENTKMFIVTLVYLILIIMLFILLSYLVDAARAQNITCTKYSDEMITFSWDDPNNPEGLVRGYKLYQSDVSGDYANPVSTFTILDPNARVHSIGTVSEGVHYFTVTGYNKDLLESDYSNQVELIITLRPEPKPETPSGLRCLGL